MKKLIALLIAAAILASLSTFALAAAIFAPKCPFDDVSADDYCYNAVRRITPSARMRPAPARR